MVQKIETRPRGDADRAPKAQSLAACVSEITPNLFALQAAFIARRFALTPTLAPIVAFHLFGEAQQ